MCVAGISPSLKSFMVVAPRKPEGAIVGVVMEVPDLSVNNGSPDRWQHLTIINKMNTITIISHRYGVVISYSNGLGICGNG